MNFFNKLLYVMPMWISIFGAGFFVGIASHSLEWGIATVFVLNALSYIKNT